MSEILLSICIPHTKNRTSVLKNTLDSIYANCTIPIEVFEVIVCDSSTNDESAKLLQSYSQYSNVVYRKSNSDAGFLNSINALKLGKGKFLKLQNDYTIFSQEGLKELLSFVKSKEDTKPLIFFNLKGTNHVQEFQSFDLFNYQLSYWHTWSTGFSIWKTDFDKISTDSVNKIFPHTSLLLLQNDKKSYIINDCNYFNNQEVPGKGGYNLFRVFAVEYLGMIENSYKEGHLTEKTFEKIKRDLFKEFLVQWYYKTKLVVNEYTYDLDGIDESLRSYYGRFGYLKLKLCAFYLLCKIKLKLRIKKGAFR